jgi:hypothetical protein
MIGYLHARMFPLERPLPPSTKASGIPRTEGELPCDSMVCYFVFVSYDCLTNEVHDICHMICIAPLIVIPGDNFDEVITEHPVFSAFARSMNAQCDGGGDSISTVHRITIYYSIAHLWWRGFIEITKQSQSGVEDILVKP